MPTSDRVCQNSPSHPLPLSPTPPCFLFASPRLPNPLITRRLMLAKRSILSAGVYRLDRG